MAMPAAPIGGSNVVELAVAPPSNLLGLSSEAALGTVFGVLVEMPVMTTIALGALRHVSGCPDARRTRPSISLAQPL